MRAEAVKRRAEDLPRDDQRGIAFTQSAGDLISNILFSSMPDAKNLTLQMSSGPQYRTSWVFHNQPSHTWLGTH